MKQSNNKIVALFLVVFFSMQLSAQTGILKGKVYIANTNLYLPNASVNLQGLNLNTTCDSIGNYIVTNIPAGTYNIIISHVGYEQKTIYEITVSGTLPTYLDIHLDKSEKLTQINVKASPFNKTRESPVSLKTIGANEIERNPGGNRDITKTIQSFPGVASSVSFRSDLIIRGGAPSENKFYLDGIEVPTINHFTTQGATGGAFGMINVNMIREVNFFSGAFPANRGNTLSSLFEFKQKDGNKEKVRYTAILGLTDLAFLANGPINKKTTFNSSIRRSYQEIIGKAFGLPVIPTYSDMQFKVKTKLSDKDEISIIGLGAYDITSLNKTFRTGANYKNLSTTNQQVFESFKNTIPENNQYNFTLGVNYKHFTSNGFHQVVISNSYFNNSYKKYKDGNDSSEVNKVLDYKSTENETKVRYEYHIRSKNRYNINVGAAYENANYTNKTLAQRVTSAGVINDNYNTSLNFNKYAAFANINKIFFDDKLIISLGTRLDGTDYSTNTSNLLNQFSPRFAATYNITNKFSFNFNTGRYYQLPPFTALGYKDNNNTLINKTNGLKYIQADHIIGGLEYNLPRNLKITTEGFFKMYRNYPYLMNKNISLANLGSDFGVIGNEPVNSTAKGRGYGLEFMAQQKLWKGFYGILSYSLMKSEFEKDKQYVPSAWDYNHIAVLTIGKRLQKNWEIGTKLRYATGGPYTPNNLNITSLKTVWDAFGQGVADSTQTNTKRIGDFFQTDIRIDKKWFFKKYNLNFYVDLQNITNSGINQPPIVYVERDINNQPVTDPTDNTRYKIKEGSYKQQINILPNLGVIFEF
jgi:TonB dependent receptor/CarboxypepD_reg-like domain/TonB-dependent Receptor Plug Domain